MTEHHKIIIASESGVRIRTFSDISDAVSASFGSAGLILSEHDVIPEFFDLRSGLAGELFQKFTNYRLRLALVVPEPGVYGERFSELAYEHRTHSMIRLVRSQDEAMAWLNS